MNFNPNTLVANRTARLVAEATTPTYSTSTPAPKEREHITAVEIDNDFGRYWSHMPDSDVEAFCERYPGEISDIDHSGKCWCFA